MGCTSQLLELIHEGFFFFLAGHVSAGNVMLWFGCGEV